MSIGNVSMKCGKCGKEFQTYNGICPFCHIKNEKITQAQPKIKDIPTVKSQPYDQSLPRNLPQSVHRPIPINTKKNSGNLLKFCLMGGIVLLVVLSVAAVAQSFIGGSPSSASTPQVPVTLEETVPPLYTTPTKASPQPKITHSGSNAGTLSPYSGDSGSINLNPVAPDYTAPGHKWTPGIASEPTANTGSVGSVVIIEPPHQVVTESTILPPPTLTTIAPTTATITPSKTTVSTPAQILKQDSRSVGERNAANSALSYLRSSSFSRSGLIKQLEYEGFTRQEAEYGVDQSGADWNEQAAKDAASYLRSSSFSRSGLIKQLEYEGFTPQQAEYGVDQSGADWNEQAAKDAASYLRSSSFSRSGLIDQLEYEGFTPQQAEYGVRAVGY